MPYPNKAEQRRKRAAYRVLLGQAEQAPVKLLGHGDGVSGRRSCFVLFSHQFFDRSYGSFMI